MPPLWGLIFYAQWVLHKCRPSGAKIVVGYRFSVNLRELDEVKKRAGNFVRDNQQS